MMYPVHDIDAILLLSMALASKRRPAELVDIIAAIDLTQGAIPSESKLADAFYRLSAYGLIREMEGGYTLIDMAQAPLPSMKVLAPVGSPTPSLPHKREREQTNRFATFTLTPDAQQMMACQRRKADTPERIFGIKENLADYNLKGEYATILLTDDQLSAAVLAHQATKNSTTKNMLAPKPKPVEDKKRPGQYKPFSARKRRDYA